MLLTLVVVAAGTGLNFWMIRHARDMPPTLWILEHIICPVLRVFVLLFVVSLVYPILDKDTDSFGFWAMLVDLGQLNDLINILFFAGLALAFIPLVSHPVFALPIQSMLTIGLVFRWQYLEFAPLLQVHPSAGTLLKIVVYMLLAYYVTRESSPPLSRWIDRRYHISGSIRLVSDAIYLLLQIPVMLFYAGFLRAQLPG